MVPEYSLGTLSFSLQLLHEICFFLFPPPLASKIRWIEGGQPDFMFPSPNRSGSPTIARHENEHKMELMNIAVSPQTSVTGFIPDIFSAWKARLNNPETTNTPMVR